MLIFQHCLGEVIKRFDGRSLKLINKKEVLPLDISDL